MTGAVIGVGGSGVNVCVDGGVSVIVGMGVKVGSGVSTIPEG